MGPRLDRRRPVGGRVPTRPDPRGRRMTRNRFPGAWYTTVRNGHRAIAIKGQHIETTRGPIPFPRGNDALFLDLLAGPALAGLGRWLVDTGRPPLHFAAGFAILCQDGMPDV